MIVEPTNFYYMEIGLYYQCSMKVIDMIELFSEKFNKPIKIIGMRPGEKMLESLINHTQSGRLEQRNNYYHIKSIFKYDKIIDTTQLKDYNSFMNPLSKSELKQYLLDRDLL